MPSLITRGGMSAKALGFGASTSGPAVYVEDVFSTYLYTGNGASQTVANNVSIGNYYAGTSGGAIQTASGSYCTVPNSTAFDFGSGNFTIEFFVYYDGAAMWDIVYKGTASTYAPFGIILGSLSGYGGYASLYGSTDGSTWQIGVSSQFNLVLNAWNHVAAVRNGNVFNIYVNGIGGTGPATVSGALVVNSQAVGLGGCNNGDYSASGRISNLRIVKGTAVYTANFTPPSSALTAISGTQLLCFQGSTPFVDNSANAFTITQVGTPSALTTGPFPYTTGNGGLVWIKNRNGVGTPYHSWFDTLRGAGNALYSNTSGATDSKTNTLTAFTGGSFSLGADTLATTVNVSSGTYASWTFRKQQKFFDVVTFSATNSLQTIAHNLGSTPGFIIIKGTNQSSSWVCYHKGLTYPNANPINNGISLNGDAVGYSYTGYWGTGPTATNFQFDTTGLAGWDFVAYLYADQAGGFGAAGADSVVACGSYTGNGSSSGPTVTLGWEPQWLLIKRASGGTGGWLMFDNMRGLPVGVGDLYLYANLSNAEAGSGYDGLALQATGFQITNGADTEINASGNTYIYLAIRRGPMKTPTDATTVFSPNTTTSVAGTTVTTNFPIDMQIWEGRAGGYALMGMTMDRLRGVSSTTTNQNSPYLLTYATDAEATSYANTQNWSNTGYNIPTVLNGLNSVYWNFRRAPGFFDEVCYTGTGSATTQAHNLGVIPELIIVKSRSGSATNWPVGAFSVSLRGNLNTNGSFSSITSSDPIFPSSPGNTATSFSIGSNINVNNSGYTYVAYLFATCAGVSKVGSYTGTGAAQNINCGFSSSARFILIRRTDDFADWYVYDSARGISASNDPYLLLNTTNAEVTGTNYVDAYASGFTLTSSAPAALNANGGSYIFLAIA